MTGPAWGGALPGRFPFFYGNRPIQHCGTFVILQPHCCPVFYIG